MSKLRVQVKHATQSQGLCTPNSHQGYRTMRFPNGSKQGACSRKLSSSNHPPIVSFPDRWTQEYYERLTNIELEWQSRALKNLKPSQNPATTAFLHDQKPKYCPKNVVEGCWMGECVSCCAYSPPFALVRRKQRNIFAVVIDPF